MHNLIRQKTFSNQTNPGSARVSFFIFRLSIHTSFWLTVSQLSRVIVCAPLRHLHERAVWAPSNQSNTVHGNFFLFLIAAATKYVLHPAVPVTNKSVKRGVRFCWCIIWSKTTDWVWLLVIRQPSHEDHQSIYHHLSTDKTSAPAAACVSSLLLFLCAVRVNFRFILCPLAEHYLRKWDLEHFAIGVCFERGLHTCGAATPGYLDYTWQILLESTPTISSHFVK